MSAKIDPRCKYCKGEFTSEAVITRKLPMGFGFAGDNKFQIDYIVAKSYKGWCMDCGKSGEVEFSRVRQTKYPRGVNAKLAKARNTVSK